MGKWQCVLTLDANRTVVMGSEKALVSSIRKGGDLRICTEFVHNEHIDVSSDSAERVREVAEFGVTYLVEDQWVAGIMNLRQPVELPTGFGPRPSMSFFLYNQDGTQAIARPYLDGIITDGTARVRSSKVIENMSKYHLHEHWDIETNAPSTNFTYDFDVFKYYVCDSWEEILHHDSDGTVLSGSVESLASAFSNGSAVKAGIADLCSDLADEHSSSEHEVFVEMGSCYYYLDQKLFIAGSHPVVRVKTGIPMLYKSQGWDFGWLILRSDSLVVYRRYNPYTLGFEDIQTRCGIRWFVR